MREEVLVKPKKLPPLLLERVQARFDLIRRTLEMEYHRAPRRLLLRARRSARGRTLEAEFARTARSWSGCARLVHAPPTSRPILPGGSGGGAGASWRGAPSAAATARRCRT